MNIAVLYICTGRYTVFWESFYKTSERYFLPNHQKNYFVFTDGIINNFDNPLVHVIEQRNLGWPDMVVKRYHIFSQIKQNLIKFDYVYFCNANLLFIETVDESIFPDKAEELIVTQHPGFYNKYAHEFTYERNQKSLAYIPYGAGCHYIGSGFNGSKASVYLELIDDLKKNTDLDLKNGITAVWHDESHLNRYILDHPYKLLSPAYLYPEGWNIPFPQKILVRDKNLLGGHDYLRGISNNKKTMHLGFSIKQRIKSAVVRIINGRNL